MKIGMAEQTIEDLAVVNEQLQSNSLEYSEDILNRAGLKRTPEFKTQKTIIINPNVNADNINLQFELRGNNEITAVGGLEDILSFFELETIEATNTGYMLAVRKDDELRRNPKSYKYFTNVCNYKKEVIYLLKKLLGLPKEEHVYFYRPEIMLLDEKETADLLKSKKHYNNFNKFIKHTIKRQKLFHNIFNVDYNLNYISNMVDKESNEEVLKLELRKNDTIFTFDSVDELSKFLDDDTQCTLNENIDNSLEESLNDEPRKINTTNGIFKTFQRINSNVFSALKHKTRIS